ncbi:complex I subunit 5 family protein [Lebetimonas natsushimae]|uniref:complex I subunit 5 family protein n=1 Tax=Lebetimonas natsushimae TaxID=1936991 RepID=UPI001556F8B0|nr:proton-conducting transporter membrane subunit [Lebetimonas natsushimae]
MEGVIFLFLLIIFSLKVFALINKENVKSSFIIASGAEILYLGVALLGSSALSAVILHLEYQFVFRVLAFLMLFEFFKFKNSVKLSDLAGVGFNKWGVIFGFSIFGSLGISLITSKQLILNSITASGMFELGYLIVAINIVQAIYLISIFETIVFKKGESLKNISNKILISVFTFAGILVFLLPQIYLILPAKFSNINAYHISFDFNYHGINGVFALLFAFIMSMVFIYSLDYIKKYKAFYYSFLAILTLALIEIPLSSSFESFYLFWETMTITSYLLIMHSRSDESIKAAKLYFVMCIAGAYFLQLTFSHFYSLGIESFSEIVNVSLTVAVLMLIGFGVKAGIVPIHQWLPVAHPAAPSSISAPLSGILTKAGIFGIIVLVYVLGFQNKIFSYLLVTLGLITLFYGEIKTLYEKDIKRLFAYSTIGQIGEIVTVLGLMSTAALSGAIYHVINHAVVKDLLFLSAGLLILSSGSRNLDDLKGIGKKLPFLAFPLGVGVFALSAFPPFGNFNSKFLMIYAAAEQNNYIVAFSLIIAGLIGFVAMLRVFRYIFLMNPQREFSEVKGIKVIAVYLLAFVSLLLGIFPQSVIDFIAAAINSTLKVNVHLPHFILQFPLSVLVMIIGAIIVYLFGKTSKTAGISAAGFSFLALLTVFADKFSFGSFFAGLVLFMAILNFLFAARYMDHSHKSYRFFANFMIMIVGILGVALSENIYSMFFYWEIMGGWALYIALVHEEDAYSIQEATKYLLYNYAGAGVIMIGLGIVMQFGNSIEIIKHIPLTNEIIFALVLLTVGFLAKAAQLPVRIDYQMHPKPAPTPISGYISSVMLKTGPFMFVMVMYLAAAGVSASKLFVIDSIGHFAAIVGVITILMGASFGLLTNSMKRLLIFLTVGEIGYIFAGVSLMTSQGLAGGLLHLINHMFFKDLLFLSAGAIFYKTGIDSLNDLGGIARKMPVTFAVFMIAVFSTAGVPMFSGFVSKWIIYHALMSKGYDFLAILTILGSVMILLVFVKFMHSAYFGKIDKKFENIKDVDWYMSLPMMILAILNIILGIFPYFALKPINLIIQSFGYKQICISLSSVCIGGDILNLFTLSIYTLLAIAIGYLMFVYNRKIRKTHIFLSGVRDLSERELHINAKNFYESVTELIKTIIYFVKKIFGLKGGYVER